MSKPDAVTPVPASTILMLRQGKKGLQVFMVVRHHQIDFASGALVFPGGKADEADFADDLINHLDGADDDPYMRGIQVAAIREAFEECGILLARNTGETSLINAARLAELENFRERLNNDELTITEFVQTNNLRLACDQLVHFAHWITPDMMPKRFDTHFYLALAPDDHLAAHDGYESVGSIWIEPEAAVADAKTGKRTVIFPTLRNVEKLGHYREVAEALEKTRSQAVVTVLPWTEKRDDGNWLCIPREAGYDISEEKMPSRG